MTLFGKSCSHKILDFFLARQVSGASFFGGDIKELMQEMAVNQIQLQLLLRMSVSMGGAALTKATGEKHPASEQGNQTKKRQPPFRKHRKGADGVLKVRKVQALSGKRKDVRDAQYQK